MNEFDKCAYEEKLKIAKIAYKDIIKVIDAWELENKVHFHWDGCISVDDELFHETELKD